MGRAGVFLTAVFRIIVPSLRARRFSGQQSEAAFGVAVLNRMLNAGRPDPSAVSRLRAMLGAG